MKIRIILPIVVLVTTLMSCGSSDSDELGNYKRRFDFAGIGRQNAASFIVNGVNYISTGFIGTTNGAQNSLTQETWKFDTTIGGLNGGNWIQVADFSGTARSGAVGFSDSKYGYVGTGVDGNFNYFSDFHVYDPNTNKWDTINGSKFTVADLTSAAGSTFGPRAYACSFTLNNIGYVGSGTGNNYYYSSFFKYNSGSNTWTKIVDIGQKTSGATAFTVNDLGYVVGGVDGSGSAVSKFWEYHPDGSTGQWISKREITNSSSDSSFDDLYTSIVRQGGVALVIQSPIVNHKQVYFMQGQNGSALNSCWQWDPPTDQWTIQNPFSGKARTGATAVQLYNRGFFTLGGATSNNSSPYDDMIEYLPGVALNTYDAN